jgi:hypothetical protein
MATRLPPSSVGRGLSASKIDHGIELENIWVAQETCMNNRTKPFPLHVSPYLGVAHLR